MWDFSKLFIFQNFYASSQPILACIFADENTAHGKLFTKFRYFVGGMPITPHPIMLTSSLWAPIGYKDIVQ